MFTWSTIQHHYAPVAHCSPLKDAPSLPALLQPAPRGSMHRCLRRLLGPQVLVPELPAAATVQHPVHLATWAQATQQPACWGRGVEPAVHVCKVRARCLQLQGRACCADMGRVLPGNLMDCSVLCASPGTSTFTHAACRTAHQPQLTMAAGTIVCLLNRPMHSLNFC